MFYWIFSCLAYSEIYSYVSFLILLIEIIKTSIVLFILLHLYGVAMTWLVEVCAPLLWPQLLHQFSNENETVLLRFQKDLRPHLSFSYRFRPSTLQRSSREKSHGRVLTVEWAGARSCLFGWRHQGRFQIASFLPSALENSVFKKHRFQIAPLWRAFSIANDSVFGDRFRRCSVDDSRIRSKTASHEAKQLRFRLKTDWCGAVLLHVKLFCSGYSYRPHYKVENDHRKRSHSKTLSRVERFENDAFRKRCFLVWTVKTMLSENGNVTQIDTTGRHAPAHSTVSIQNGGQTIPCGFSLDRNDFQSFDALAILRLDWLPFYALGAFLHLVFVCDFQK